MSQDKPAEAIALLEPSRKYELGVQGPSVNYWPPYIRGLAYLRLREGAKAAVEFQKILDHRGGGAVNNLLPVSQLQPARAYAVQGDIPKARACYQDFLTLWKDADVDIPILIAAKAEYAKLH